MILCVRLNLRVATNILGYDLFGRVLVACCFQDPFSYSSFPKYFLVGVLDLLASNNKIKYF
jgi:hypothetical protein